MAPVYAHREYLAAYYITARFILIDRLLQAYRRPLAMIDADVEIKRDLEGFFELDRHDVGLIIRDEGKLEWRRLLAAAVFVNDTARARQFVRFVADCVADDIWGDLPFSLDALYLSFCHQAALAQSEIRFGKIPMGMSDHNFTPSRGSGIARAIASAPTSRSVFEPPVDAGPAADAGDNWRCVSLPSRKRLMNTAETAAASVFAVGEKYLSVQLEDSCRVSFIPMACNGQRRWPAGCAAGCGTGGVAGAFAGSRCKAAERYYRFLCDNLIEYARCAGLFIKEPGTCEWIRRDVRQGDVFFDIGANIGIYTIMAAHQVGSAGKVVAFEPHAANFAALINNVAANGFGDRVIPCNAGAHASSGFLTFNYASLTAGTSNSQLDGDCVPGRAPFHPVAHELKPAVALDELVASGVLPRPTHVKIDVDGNEMEILAGMAGLLSHADRPRSLSIEVNAEEQVECERRLRPVRLPIGQHQRDENRRQAQAPGPLGGP